MITIRTIPVILFSFFIASCAGKTEKLDCSSLKEGRFKTRGLAGEGELIIERNDSMQTETDNSTGLVAKLRIEWISQCEYILTAQSLILRGEAMEMDKKFLTPLITRVIKVTSNYYEYATREKGKSKETKGTLLILK